MTTIGLADLPPSHLIAEPPLRIYLFGDREVHTATKPVKEVNDEVMRTASRMLRAMRTASGVGISAPQIGSDLSMSLVSAVKGTQPDEKGDSVLLLNPRLVWHGEGRTQTMEGCLSIDPYGWKTSVWRWNKVEVAYQDSELKPQVWKAQGFVARILQHELDHLDGKMISDKLTRQQRRAVERIVQHTRSMAVR